MGRVSSLLYVLPPLPWCFSIFEILLVDVSCSLRLLFRTVDSSNLALNHHATPLRLFHVPSNGLPYIHYTHHRRYGYRHDRAVRKHRTSIFCYWEHSRGAVGCTCRCPLDWEKSSEMLREKASKRKDWNGVIKMVLIHSSEVKLPD
jgi:hypothetical protein